jgi:DNA-binding transcriptional LysR family regulator
VDLDLSCVASFLVLLDERHYGRAAAKLNLTSSALSKRIQRLERQVGVRLVVRRSAEGCSATEAGERFAAHTGALLSSADAAKRAARSATQGVQRLIFGVPASPMGYLEQLELKQVVQQVRLSHPEARIERRAVPFTALRSALVDKEVDVLLTSSPVAHVETVSTPLPITVGRMGIVGRRHALAGTTSIDVGDFVDLPMLYSPAVPDEWMTQFYLGDLRPRREARLVEANAQDAHDVTRAVIGGTGVTIGPEMFAGVMGPHLHGVRLHGAPPIAFYAARRRAESRSAVLAIVSALERLPSRHLKAHAD